jgi:hypothetical protein
LNSTTWQEANNECESLETGESEMKAELLEFKSKSDLDIILSHPLSPTSTLTSQLLIHIKMKLFNMVTATRPNNNRFTFNNNNNEDESHSPLNIHMCQSSIPTNSSKNITNDDQNLITFFNSELVFKHQDNQCYSIAIQNTTNKNSIKYCIQDDSCLKVLPFVCKIKKQSKRGSGDYHFYPDSLKNYQQDPKMSYVINSFLAITYGLNKMHKRLCNGTFGLCDKMKIVNGSELLKDIKESSFKGITDESIYFDASGDPPGRYVILNVQKRNNQTNNSSASYYYKNIGNWDNQYKLNVNLDDTIFPSSTNTFRSVCSEPCKFGYVKQIKQGGLKCCWNCKKCEPYAFVLNEFTCQECDLGHWPNSDLTGN